MLVRVFDEEALGGCRSIQLRIGRDKRYGAQAAGESPPVEGRGGGKLNGIVAAKAVGSCQVRSVVEEGRGEFNDDVTLRNPPAEVPDDGRTLGRGQVSPRSRLVMAATNSTTAIRAM
jgi:hypothetical protein